VSPRPPPAATTCILVIDRPVGSADVADLCDRLRVLVAGSEAEIVVCDARGLAANLTSIDALVRLRLSARRLGRQFRVHRVSPELSDLIAFCGVADVMRVVGELRLEACRQPEQREQPRGVEERDEVRDAPARDLDDL
jgi:STAS domain